MPEGHTIHRLARDHKRDFVGQKLRVSSPQGRFTAEAKKLNGTVLNGVEAFGKHLFYEWGQKVVHIHLGLYGKFRRHKLPVPEPRGAVRVRLIGNTYGLDLNGPNCCELITAEEQASIVDRIGPDPLRKDADPDRVWNRISRSRAAIGTLLLNQTVIAGVGNVYRAEILFLLGIHPETPGRELERDEFDKLWETCSELLKIGVRYNRIIVADPEDVGKPRSRMNRTERLLVYKKPACTRCETPIETSLLGSRKMYACPVCQPKRD
ncbi:MAG: Fpg/Nei family DNA glycosylase [Planctomycetaceae bacterium]